jgi:hypothetical protein
MFGCSNSDGYERYIPGSVFDDPLNECTFKSIQSNLETLMDDIDRVYIWVMLSPSGFHGPECPLELGGASYLHHYGSAGFHQPSS